MQFQDDGDPHYFTNPRPDPEIEAVRGEVVCLGFRHQNDHSDTMSDYCATIFCDSMAQAMRLASK